MNHRSNKNEAVLAKSLYEAVESTDIRRVFVILREQKANPNFILDSNGISPFHFAIGIESKKFAYETTKLMLLHGADPNVRSEDKITPVHIATAWNRTAILHQLLKAGGDPHLRDDEDKSAVDYAVEGGLTKVLQIINYHTTQRIPSKKVYLYRDDVRAEYSARPVVDKRRWNGWQEEVFKYPENWSSSEGSGSEVSITHRITMPSDGNIRIESSVKSDDKKTVKHQYELEDSNIKRTIMKYLKDSQVYECNVPGDGGSSRSAPLLKDNCTPERSIRSHISTPNHKTPSSVNFSSLCNNLAKELHEKLKPQLAASGLNVSNENRDLYTTCLVEPQEVVASCSKNTNLESSSSLQKYPRKCVRNIFINECNTKTNSPSHSLESQNIPFNFAEKSVCKHCEEILCNNFKIVCYHFCDSRNPVSCSGDLPNNAHSENLSDSKVWCKNNSRNLLGFEGIEQDRRPARRPLKAVPSPNQIRNAPVVDFVDGDFRRKSVDRCDSAAKSRLDKGSSTPVDKKLKSKPNSNFLKNRAKLEKAFLNCLRKSQVNDESPEKGNMSSHVAKTPVIVNGSPNLDKISSSVQERRKPENLSNHGTRIQKALNEMNEHSDAADSSYSSSVVNDSYQSINVDVVNNEWSGDPKTTDPSSPKRCNICDYHDQSNEMSTSQADTNPLFLKCNSNTCSESRENRLSLPVSSSPVKLNENCVELHLVPDAKSDEASKKEISSTLDGLNKSSSTFETVIKVSSNESIFLENETESKVDQNAVLSPVSAESLTNISDMLSISPENPCKLSFEDEKESNPTRCLDVAFCLDSGLVENTAMDRELKNRDSNSQRKSELSSYQSEHSDTFFSSSERCSPLGKGNLALNENLQDALDFLESSSDYFSPNELTRSYFTSDEEPSFLAPIAGKTVQNLDAISSEQCDNRLRFEHETECGYGVDLITSDDEPASKSEPEFNVCEEYKYVDKEKDIVFRETRFKSSTVSYLFRSFRGTIKGRKMLRKGFMRLFHGSKKSESS